MSGIVPFLGTFTKDLEYLHSQNSMKNEKGMINIMKLRKEHEIIAQIKLLQKASELYNIKEDPGFNVWLHKQPIYSGDQYYEFSYMIEPKFDRENSSNGNLRKSKYTSLSQTSNSNSIESINSFNNNNSNNNYNSANKTPLSTSKLNHSPSGQKLVIDHSRNSSMGSSDLIDSSNSSSKRDSKNTNTVLNIDTHSNDSNEENLSAKFSQQSMNPSSEMRIKVKIEPDYSNSLNKEQLIASTVLYKQLSISDKYRTKDVKRLILQKFFLNPDLCDNYYLVQVFNMNNSSITTTGASTTNHDHNELIINDKDNVFYAAKKVNDMQFVLRPKNNSSNFSHGNNIGSSKYGSSAKLNELPPPSPYSNSNGNLHKLNSNGKATNYGTHKNWFKKWI